MEKNSKKWLIYAIIIGILLALLAGGFGAYKDYRQDGLWNTGKTYDILQVSYNNCFSNDEIEKKYDSQYIQKIDTKKKMGGYNYLLIVLSNNLPEDSKIVIKTYSNGKDLLSSQSIEKKLYRENSIKINKIKGFDSFSICIFANGAKNTTIKRISLRENDWVRPNIIEGLLYSLVTLLIYVMSIVIYKIFSKKYNCTIYEIANIPKEIFKLERKILVPFGKHMSKNENICRIIRIIALLNMFFILTLPCFSDLKQWHRAIICGILIGLISITLTDEEKKDQSWKNPVAFGWTAVIGSAVLSSIAIHDRKGALILIIIFMIFGFYYYVNDSAEKRNLVIKDLLMSIHVIFIIFLFIAATDIPTIVGDRYAGFLKNPSVYGLITLPIFVAAVTEIENAIRTDKKFWQLAIYVIEATLSFASILRSGSATPTIAGCLVALLWLIRQIKYSRMNEKLAIKKVLVIAICVLLLMPVMYKGFESLQGIFARNTKTVEITENIESSKEGDDSSGIIRLQEKFKNKSVSRILSGRDYYWRKYISNLSLLGHSKKPFLLDHRILPHNAVIGISYNYGVVAGLFYVIMIIAILIRSYEDGKKKFSYCGAPLYFSVSFIVSSMADNIEIPFDMLPWIVFYMMLGIVFGETKQDER